MWWAHQGSNLGPTGYEPVALPAELWALVSNFTFKKERLFNSYMSLTYPADYCQELE